MQKYTTPTPADPRHNIFTENINYHLTDKQSIWGRDDADTIKLLKRIDLTGAWLDLCAGDGRYVDLLIPKIDKLIVADIDKGALSKLLSNAGNNPKITSSVFDVTKPFPYIKDCFEGVFCTGTLHLFKPAVLQDIFREITRILSVEGKLIIDFATDIKRTYPDGRVISSTSENIPEYHYDEALAMVKNFLPDFKIIEVMESQVDEDLTTVEHLGFHFTCRYFVLVAERITSV